MAIVKSQVVSQRGSGGDRTAENLAVSTGDILVAVCTSQDSNTNNIPVASVKFNTTEAFTLEKAMGGSGGTGQPVRIEIWHLKNPSATTANVIADFVTGINESTLTVYRLSGADTTTPINGTSDGDTGNGFAPAMSITTDADSCFLIGGLCSEADITGVGTDQSADSDFVDQSYENTVVSSEAGGAAGAQAHSYSMASGSPYAQAMVAIKPAAGGNLSVSTSDTCTVGETITINTTPSVSVSDTSTLSDSITVTKTASELTVTVSDTATVGDSSHAATSVESIRELTAAKLI
jgi:hypothetical protein